jgi:hypothetical protein
MWMHIPVLPRVLVSPETEYFSDSQAVRQACSGFGGEKGNPRTFICVDGLVLTISDVLGPEFDETTIFISVLPRSICIPSSVERLGDRCFSRSADLCVVTFEPESKLSRIGDSAFVGCSSLSSICIPGSVEILCGWCFACCPNLSTVTFESDSALSEICDGAFSQCSSLSSIFIPLSVESIYRECFSVCTALAIVVFETGSNLSQIRPSTFRCCPSLSSICIPAGVRKLHPKSFLDCWQLSSVTFESGAQLSQLEFSAFWNCPSLLSICIPASVESVDFSVLHWFSIRDVSVEEANRSLRMTGSFLLDFAGGSLIRSCGDAPEVAIPNAVEVLASYSFGPSDSLVSVAFEPVCRVSLIDSRAFYHCSSLASICVPSSVGILGKECFCGRPSACDGQVGIPGKTLGDRSFCFLRL